LVLISTAALSAVEFWLVCVATHAESVKLATIAAAKYLIFIIDPFIVMLIFYEIDANFSLF
jgi:hypothetical protein